VYQYLLTVTDDDGATASDTITVSVNPLPNLAPYANAGADVILTLPVNATTLIGSGTDADGTIVSYAWEKIAGPASGNISGTNADTAQLSGLVQGVYQYLLTVTDNGGSTATDTDNGGSTATDTVRVTVNAPANLPPTANAGTDITVTLPTNNATLNGSGIDTDGTIVSYSWVKITGPAGGSISNSSLQNPDVSVVYKTRMFLY